MTEKEGMGGNTRKDRKLTDIVRRTVEKSHRIHERPGSDSLHIPVHEESSSVSLEAHVTEVALVFLQSSLVADAFSHDKTDL